MADDPDFLDRVKRDLDALAAVPFKVEVDHEALRVATGNGGLAGVFENLMALMERHAALTARQSEAVKQLSNIAVETTEQLKAIKTNVDKLRDRIETDDDTKQETT
jgi:hypothetical protein